ncbi:hypothetical protein D3C83_232880 [compost metagenome]
MLLQSLIDPNDPLFGTFVIEHASAINDSGQILVNTVGYERTYVLTPLELDEPLGGLAALTLSVVALGCLRNLRRA